MQIKTFLEYQNKGEDIYDALGLDTSDKCKKFRLFLKQNNLTECLFVSDKAAYPNSWVGAICYGKRQIEILPKLLSGKTANLKDGDGIGENQRERGTILENLIFMLSYTRKLNIKVAKDASLSQSQNPFLEILIREFAISLFEALKCQTPRAYMRQEENLNYVKGKIQIIPNIRYNSCNKAKFFCEYDEFSEDNQLNRLFLYVATMLSSLSRNSRNKQVLGHIRNYYCDVSLLSFTKEQAKKIVLSRNQQIFARPLQLALMFIEHSSVDLSNHKINNVALLWDMNVLFEEFVYEVMRRHCKDIHVIPQKKRKLLRSMDDAKLRYSRDTNVDILAEYQKHKIVIDTKYKKVTDISEVSTSDVYQVATYCSLHNAEVAVLIYPQISVSSLGYYELNKDKNIDCKTLICFEMIDICEKNLEDRVNDIGKVFSEVVRGTCDGRV